MRSLAAGRRQPLRRCCQMADDISAPQLAHGAPAIGRITGLSKPLPRSRRVKQGPPKLPRGVQP